MFEREPSVLVNGSISADWEGRGLKVEGMCGNICRAVILCCLGGQSGVLVLALLVCLGQGMIG